MSYTHSIFSSFPRNLYFSKPNTSILQSLHDFFCWHELECVSWSRQNEQRLLSSTFKGHYKVVQQIIILDDKCHTPVLAHCNSKETSAVYSVIYPFMQILNTMSIAKSEYAIIEGKYNFSTSFRSTFTPCNWSPMIITIYISDNMNLQW